jgi:hypothetical protein
LREIDRDPRGRRCEERFRVPNGVTILVALPPKPGFLHDVFGIVDTAEHPVRDAEQPRSGPVEDASSSAEFLPGSRERGFRL